eukprot:TRINITY_DN24133_c0_g1_i1.p1 TRINITY_DN24133_c0_g1~~TRINITY_DN24133_c0_g1_i1.p1  ORF type:complete len:278 (-),score=28.70 TRINITY_DN24133_c0_g1_i1:176-973(-)
MGNRRKARRQKKEYQLYSLGFLFFRARFDKEIQKTRTMKSIFIIASILLKINALYAPFSASFFQEANIEGDGSGIEVVANNVTNQSSPGFVGGTQLVGSFVSSENNFTNTVASLSRAIYYNSGAQSFTAFQTTASNFVEAGSNSTFASLQQTLAGQDIGQTVTQSALQQVSNGTSVWNSSLYVESQAGFQANDSRVVAYATFEGSGDASGLLPSQSTGAITGALANSTGMAAACSGTSQAQIVQGATNTSSGCEVSNEPIVMGIL